MRGKELQNKEEVYEKEVKPLVDQLYELCEKHDIPFVAACQTSDTDFIGSCSLPDDAADQMKLIVLILEHGAPKVLMSLAVEQAVEHTPVKMVD